MNRLLTSQIPTCQRAASSSTLSQDSAKGTNPILEGPTTLTILYNLKGPPPIPITAGVSTDECWKDTNIQSLNQAKTLKCYRHSVWDPRTAVQFS